MIEPSSPPPTAYLICKRDRTELPDRLPHFSQVLEKTKLAAFFSCWFAEREVHVRTQAKLKLGYYPLAAAEARWIGKYLEFPVESASVLDPCAGTGAALHLLTEGARVRRYGVELDAYRAGEAQQTLDEVIQGSAFDTHAPIDSFSLLYLNPPYDFEMGEGHNQRMERLFLEHVARWVRPGGVLVLIVPYNRVLDCRTVLTPQFRDKAIYRLTEPEATLYKQVVLFGIRRTRQERERLNDHAVGQANRKLHEMTRRYEDIPALPDVPDRTYIVPPSATSKLDYRGLPLDALEDLLDRSPAWRQAQRITHAPKPEFSGRPLTSLHQGHVAMLCTSGVMNGCFGHGTDRHVAYWESVKVVDRHEEEDEGTTVIRERERFSQRLTLLYADGRMALLSERAPESTSRKEDLHAERTLAYGPANDDAAKPRGDHECHGGPELACG
jgi:tRNA1(Val) A37 N6-methylase TrmN6